jgi:hypothetical protein
MRPEATSVEQKVAVFVSIHLPGEHQLAMVIHASYAVSLELGLIQRREKHRGKNPDNGNHHEQFD